MSIGEFWCATGRRSLEKVAGMKLTTTKSGDPSAVMGDSCLRAAMVSAIRRRRTHLELEEKR